MASTVIGGSPVSLISGSGVFSPLNTYSTLPKLRRYLMLASADTSDDDSLRDFLRASSRAIDRYCHRVFYPHRRISYFDLPEKKDVLRIDDDLLEVKGLSHLNGASEFDSNTYWLKSGDDWNKTPYDRIVIDTARTGSVLNFIVTPRRAIHTDVILGYNSDYDNAWIDSGASLVNSITSTQTQIDISGSVGADLVGNAPRFEEGQIWKIDNEFILASSGVSASVISTIRGINGTTAASHAASVTVNVFDVEKDIEFATRRLAAMEHHQAQAPYTGRQIAINFGAVIESQDEWPQDVKGRINRYRKHRIYAL